MQPGRSSAHQTLPYALRLEQKLLRRGAGARSGDALQLVTAGSLCICFIQQTNASGMGSEAPPASLAANWRAGPGRACVLLCPRAKLCFCVDFSLLPVRSCCFISFLCLQINSAQWCFLGVWCQWPLCSNGYFLLYLFLGKLSKAVLCKPEF